jgi:hypothetical protein
MFKIRSTTQLAAAFLAAGCFSLALGARADAGPQSKTEAAGSTCESARVSAWFARQRELTEGNTDPFQGIATPRECAMTYGANATDKAAPDKKVAAAAKLPRQELRWDFQGALSGQ